MLLLRRLATKYVETVLNIEMPLTFCEIRLHDIRSNSTMVAIALEMRFLRKWNNYSRKFQKVGHGDSVGTHSAKRNVIVLFSVA